MVLSVRPDVSGRANKIILPSLPAVGDGLFHLWTGGHTRFPLPEQKNSEKEKSSEKPQKHLFGISTKEMDFTSSV